MTLEEQITIFEHNAEHERKEGDLNNCLHFRQLAEWLKDYKRLLEQEHILEKIETEIKALFKEPAYYIPNYDAYKKVLGIIDKYKAEGSEE